MDTTTALIVRDKNAPTVKQLEEQRRQKEEARQRGRARTAKMSWTYLGGAIIAAECIFIVVMLVDISQDHHSQTERPNLDSSTPPISSAAKETPEERSFDFEDPAPITEKMSFSHLIRYGGWATILDTGARQLRNRFTKEPVVTRGELRRYQVMLDLHDQRIDGSVSDKFPRDVVETVMRDLHK